MLQVYEATLRGAALAYAADGRPVFPVGARTKAPATKRGFYDATLNPAAIERWWRAQDYNVGIATGASPASGCSTSTATKAGKPRCAAGKARRAAGDLDFEHRARLARLVSLHGPVPSSTGRIAPSIDVKADGGYVVAPPSIHPSGRAYAWAGPARGEPAEAPGLARRLRAGASAGRDHEPDDRPQRAARPLRRCGARSRDCRARRRRRAERATTRSIARPSASSSWSPAVNSTAPRCRRAGRGLPSQRAG